MFHYSGIIMGIEVLTFSSLLAVPYSRLPIAISAVYYEKKIITNTKPSNSYKSQISHTARVRLLNTRLLPDPPPPSPTSTPALRKALKNA